MIMLGGGPHLAAYETRIHTQGPIVAVGQLLVLGEIPGVLWTPDGAAGIRPLVLIGRGGRRHKMAPEIVTRAHSLVAECGFAAPTRSHCYRQTAISGTAPVFCSRTYRVAGRQTAQEAIDRIDTAAANLTALPAP